MTNADNKDSEKPVRLIKPKKRFAAGFLCFGKRKITSFDTVTLSLSWMRGFCEYEMVMKEGRAQLSLYRLLPRREDGEEERSLQKRAECGAKQALALLNNCRLLSWDGFCGRHPRRVMDGTIFNMSATVNGGGKIHASGSQNFPRGYRKLLDGFDDILNDRRKTELYD